MLFSTRGSETRAFTKPEVSQEVGVFYYYLCNSHLKQISYLSYLQLL